MSQTAEMLRYLKALQGPFPEFDLPHAPPDPITLFKDWLESAISHDVPEPHAMTLSTVDADGLPDARVLILKDVNHNGFYFATSTASRKGDQLASRPKTALTFHWKEMARQVRIRGTVCDQGDEASAADYLVRPVGSRAGAAVGKQSQILDDSADVIEAINRSKAHLRDKPDFVTAKWRLLAVSPDEVEFWQGAASRQHERLRYQRDGDVFRVERLWP